VASRTRTLTGLLLAVGIAACGPSSDLRAEARQKQAAGDFAGSLEILGELLAERPDDAEVQYLYGRALSLTRQPSLAQWSLSKAMDNPEWLVPAGLQRAIDALRMGDYPSAIEATERILEVHPDNADALLMRANANAHSERDFEQALLDVDRLLELQPGNANAMEPRILALLGLERYEEAGAAIDELGKRIRDSELGPDLVAWHCATQAIFADESGEPELALERWESCLERYPAHPNVVSNALDFYDARGDTDRSLEILRGALEAAPESLDYRDGLALRLSAQGRNEEAEALLREATEFDDPTVAVLAWMFVAEHHQALGDYAAGAAAAERAVGLARTHGPLAPELLFAYADALVRATEFDRALSAADEITVVSHRELVRARVAQGRGQPAQALEHFDAGFRLWPNNASARFYAALAAEDLGDFDRAIEELRYSLRADPSAGEARMRLARLYTAEGKVDRARKTLHAGGARVQLDLEARLLSLQLTAGAGQLAPGVISRFRPEFRGRAMVAAARGVRSGAGPNAAVRFLRAEDAVDLRDPLYSDALRALVRYANEAGEPAKAAMELRAALEAHPEAAALHEIDGLRLELRGASADEVRQAYARALKFDPENARALQGLGRLALERDPVEALALFDRAAAADPGAASADPAAELTATQALIAAGRLEEATERLKALGALHPYDAQVAMALLELEIERGIATQRTLALARRAVRFGGGADALDLLSRVHLMRNEPERAAAAAQRARSLRGANPPGV
jgi:tetratricopeptide (TPR) repeat protein